MSNDGFNERTFNFPVYMKENGQTIICPEILTETEAIQFLRLDVDGPKDPTLTLRYYREQGLLRGIRIGKRYRYSKNELLRFVDVLSQENGPNRR